VTDTTAALLGDSVIALMDQGFLISNLDNLIYDQLVSWDRDINAKSIEFPEYSKLALATTPLTDGTNATPVAMSDSQHIFTPEEYGNAIATTSLAKLQTGGKATVAAGSLVGINAGETQNRLAFLALAASTNIIVANDAASEGAIVEGDTMQATDVAEAYTGLAANNAQFFGGPAGPTYIAVAHPHILHDVMELDDWKDVVKYATPEQRLKNEVGQYKGFRWLSTTGNAINTDAGAGTVDTYDTNFFGFNALGKAISKDVELVLKMDGSDPHNRRLFTSWYGVLKYGIVDQNALQMITSSSSQGSN